MNIIKMVKGKFIFAYVIIYSIFCLWSVSAFQFNGTVLDINGNRLNNTLVNVTVRSVNGFSVVGYNFTTTNASGWFNFTVAESGNDWMYEPVIRFTNSTYGNVQYVGQTLPAFPKEMLTQIAGTTFYLKEAGTINITAINSSAARTSFYYQIKDQKLGYPISQNFATYVSESLIYVPRDRNYSIMIYPNQSMPVSFDWNNFSSTSSYNISNLSRFNATTTTLHYQFNTTLIMKRISGYINHSSASGWNEFTVVPYLLEPGGMVHLNFGDMPYNLSGFVGGTDVHNLSNGFYNISLPGTAETSSILLFATTRNGSIFYGGFRNISLSTASSAETINFNFSAMSILLGTSSNITLEKLDGTNINISSAKQNFSLINSTNGSLSQVSVHAEITVDYSSLGAREITWMADITQNEAPNILVPLLNSTGIKEMNVFVSGGNYAPKRASYTLSEIQNKKNITISSFNPGDIDGSSLSGLKIALYASNSSCDVPSPSAGCVIGDSEGENFTSFNPMKSIMGGGKLSFRMGLISSGIVVHYVNVDMLASGPPDALFDDSTTNRNSGTSFDQAIRFGSQGPTIYDYVLISMPYTETGGSGLDDTGTVNASIPLLYNDNWNIIWNASINGTNASALSGNYSHYSARSSEWTDLMVSKECHTNSSAINSSQPCYIDKTNNRIWIRLPHFSGTGPQIIGKVVAAASSSTSSSGGGSGGTSSFWTTTIGKDSQDIKDYTEKGLDISLKEKERVRIKVNNEQHHVGIIGLTNTQITINISSTSQQATLSIGESKDFELNDDNTYDITIKLNDIKNLKANLTILSTTKKVEPSQQADESQELESQTATDSTQDESSNEKEGVSLKTIIISIILIILILVIFFFLSKKIKEKKIRSSILISKNSKSIKVS